MQGVDYGSVDENKVPDFVQAKAKGLTFVIIRGSYCVENSVIHDSNLARDRVAAHAAGLVVGSYVIVDYKLNPEDQARAFISSFGSRQDHELPPWIDCETNSQIHDAKTVAQRIDWVQRVYDVLQRFYEVVGTYTSENQWGTNFGNMPSRLGNGPLWLKVPYPFKAKQPPHPEACPELGPIPAPWRSSSSPGVWIQQYQGDAKGAPGFTSTVDLNAWNVTKPGDADALNPWIRTMCARANCTSVAEFQHVHGLVPDGIVGPLTFAALAR